MASKRRRRRSGVKGLRGLGRQDKPPPGVVPRQWLLLLGLFQAVHGRALVHTINKVNERIAPCFMDASLLGYHSIGDMNADQQMEVDRIARGEMPRTPYVFPLCPDAIYEVREEPLRVLLDDITFVCGSRGESSDHCWIEGGGPQLVVPNGYSSHLLLWGITFRRCSGPNMALRPESTYIPEGNGSFQVTFRNVIWQDCSGAILEDCDGVVGFADATIFVGSDGSCRHLPSSSGAPPFRSLTTTQQPTEPRITTDSTTSTRTLASKYSRVILDAAGSDQVAEISVIDILAIHVEASSLLENLNQAGLSDRLRGNGPFTLFAPTNDAFDAGDFAKLKTAAYLPHFTDLLAYHVAPELVLSSGLLRYRGEMLNGQRINITSLSPPTINSGASITIADQLSDNGIVHFMDAVLLPPSYTMDAVTAVLVDPELSILFELLTSADLLDTLRGDGPFTIFAPNNQAFEKLDPGLSAILSMEGDPVKLANVLTGHAATGIWVAEELGDGLALTMLNGDVATIGLDPTPVIDDATIVETNRLVNNGVLHIIDAVLGLEETTPSPSLSPSAVPTLVPYEQQISSTAPSSLFTIPPTTTAGDDEIIAALPPTAVPVEQIMPTTTPNSFATMMPTREDEDFSTVTPTIFSGTVWDVVLDDANLLLFKRGLVAVNISSLLSNPDLNFTVFAPTNRALASEPSLEFYLRNLDRWTGHATKALQSHIVPNFRISRQALWDGLFGEVLVTLSGSSLGVNISARQVGGQVLVQPDSFAMNGAVQILDGLLDRGLLELNLIEVLEVLSPLRLIQGSGEFDSFLENFSASFPVVYGELSTLKEEGATVVAPWNVAFAEVDLESLNGDYLLYHVIESNLYQRSASLTQRLVRTRHPLADVWITVDSTGVKRYNDVEVQSEWLAENGVIHVTGTVLKPPTMVKMLEIANEHTYYNVSILLDLFVGLGWDVRDLPSLLGRAQGERFTLLAPSDSAFLLYLHSAGEKARLLSPLWSRHLRNVILNLLAPVPYTKSELQELAGDVGYYEMEMVGGSVHRVFSGDSLHAGHYIGDAPNCIDGVIHFVEDIVLPLSVAGGVYDMLNSGNRSTSIFRQYIADSAITWDLDYTAPLTLLVPTDTAFDTTMNQSEFDAIIRNHMFNDMLFVDDLAKMDGDNISSLANIFWFVEVNGPSIFIRNDDAGTRVEVETDGNGHYFKNGVAHFVKGLLIAIQGPAQSTNASQLVNTSLSTETNGSDGGGPSAPSTGSGPLTSPPSDYQGQTIEVPALQLQTFFLVFNGDGLKATDLASTENVEILNKALDKFMISIAAELKGQRRRLAIPLITSHTRWLSASLVPGSSRIYGVSDTECSRGDIPKESLCQLVFAHYELYVQENGAGEKTYEVAIKSAIAAGKLQTYFSEVGPNFPFRASAYQPEAPTNKMSRSVILFIVLACVFGCGGLGSVATYFSSGSKEATKGCTDESELLLQSSVHIGSSEGPSYLSERPSCRTPAGETEDFQDRCPASEMTTEENSRDGENINSGVLVQVEYSGDELSRSKEKTEGVRGSDGYNRLWGDVGEWDDEDEPASKEKSLRAEVTYQGFSDEADNNNDWQFRNKQESTLVNAAYDCHSRTDDSIQEKNGIPAADPDTRGDAVATRTSASLTEDEEAAEGEEWNIQDEAGVVEGADRPQHIDPYMAVKTKQRVFGESGLGAAVSSDSVPANAHETGGIEQKYVARPQTLGGDESLFHGREEKLEVDYAQRLGSDRTVEGGSAFLELERLIDAAFEEQADINLDGGMQHADPSPSFVSEEAQSTEPWADSKTGGGTARKALDVSGYCSDDDYNDHAPELQAKLAELDRRVTDDPEKLVRALFSHLDGEK